MTYKKISIPPVIARYLVPIVLVVVFALSGLTYLIVRQTTASDKKTVSTTSLTAKQAGSTPVPTNPTTGTNTMNLGPTTVAVVKGSTFSVTAKQNSGTEPVNATQVNLSYDAKKLQVVSVRPGAFSTQVVSQYGGGSAQFAYGTTARTEKYSGLAGVQPIVTITFKAINTGTAAVRFSDGTTMVSGRTNAVLPLAYSGVDFLVK